MGDESKIETIVINPDATADEVIKQLQQLKSKQAPFALEFDNSRALKPVQSFFGPKYPNRKAILDALFELIQAQSKNLVQLSLQGNHLTADKTRKLLTAFPGGSVLTELDLANNDIRLFKDFADSEKALKIFLAHCKQLDNLDLSGNKDISAKDLYPSEKAILLKIMEGGKITLDDDVEKSLDENKSSATAPLLKTFR